MKSILGLLATLVAAYLLLLFVLRLFENQFIFFPDYPGRLIGDWHPAELPVEEVWLRTPDGVKLHAWWIAGDGAQFTFLAFHGNAANIANRADAYRFLRELPANVLAVEYRGYGHSEGTPSEEGLYLDAEAGYEYLVAKRGIAPGRIVVLGQSLGTAVAAALAAQREVGGVVLEAPFPSAPALAGRIYPFLPGLGAVMRARFATSEKLARVRVPVLIVHCTRDPVIAFSLGEEVFRQAREPKFFLRIEDACHEEASLVAPAEYRAALLDFLARLKAER